VIAFSGRNISEDSLATSMAILAALYAVCQPVAFPRIATSSLDVSRVLENAELTGGSVGVEGVASALELFRDIGSCTGSEGDVGVGVSAGRFDLRSRGMTKVDDKINPIISPASRPPIDNVITASGVGVDFAPCSGLRNVGHFEFGNPSIAPALGLA